MKSTTITNFKIQVFIHHVNDTINEEAQMIGVLFSKEEIIRRIDPSLKKDMIKHLNHIEFFQQQILFIVRNQLPIQEGIKLSFRAEHFQVTEIEYRIEPEKQSIIFKVKLSRI